MVVASAVEPLFQPALPMRGVTSLDCQRTSMNMNFNPHSPCGE